MVGDDNIVKIVVVSNDPILPESLENVLDSRRYVLETISPNSRSIAEIRKMDPDIFYSFICIAAVMPKC